MYQVHKKEKKKGRQFLGQGVPPFRTRACQKTVHLRTSIPDFFCFLVCTNFRGMCIYLIRSIYIYYTLQLAPLPLAETLVSCPFACALNRDRCRGYGGAPILLQPPGLADLGLGGPLARRRQPLKPLLFEHMLGLSIRVAVSVFSKSVLLGRCLEVPDYKPGTSEPRAKKWCAAFPTVPCVSGQYECRGFDPRRLVSKNKKKEEKSTL